MEKLQASNSKLQRKSNPKSQEPQYCPLACRICKLLNSAHAYGLERTSSKLCRETWTGAVQRDLDPGGWFLRRSLGGETGAALVEPQRTPIGTTGAYADGAALTAAGPCFCAGDRGRYRGRGCHGAR